MATKAPVWCWYIFTTISHTIEVVYITASPLIFRIAWRGGVQHGRTGQTTVILHSPRYYPLPLLTDGGDPPRLGADDVVGLFSRNAFFIAVIASVLVHQELGDLRTGAATRGGVNLRYSLSLWFTCSPSLQSIISVSAALHAKKKHTEKVRAVRSNFSRDLLPSLSLSPPPPNSLASLFSFIQTRPTS